MKKKILEMLRLSGDYVSGQQICERFGVSRTAVWKAINSLKAEGYQIEAVQNKGYRLISSPDILSPGEIGFYRKDRWKNSPIYVYEETDSTNNRIRQLTDQGAPEGTLAVAEVQTGGKGRRGRKWETPAGISVAMSFSLKPAFEPSKASMLTLVAGVASCRAVEELTGVSPQIKWPNDLVMNRKKINGILTEMVLEENYIQQIIVGIGFNVHQESFPEELKDKATSLWMELGQHYSRAKLIALVMKYFAEYYGIFEKEQSLAFLKEEYDQLLISRNQPVRILSPVEDWTGISLGIDEEGALLVQTEDGMIRRVTAGEVSVRGLYSYT